MGLGFIEILKTILLGIVEGVTEWLPISSTGHMILFDEFIHLNVTPEFKEIFLVVIQLGAILAVAVMFWKTIFPFSESVMREVLNIPSIQKRMNYFPVLFQN